MAQGKTQTLTFRLQTLRSVLRFAYLAGWYLTCAHHPLPLQEKYSPIQAHIDSARLNYDEIVDLPEELLYVTKTLFVIIS